MTSLAKFAELVCMAKAKVIELSEEERRELQKRVNARSGRRHEAQRAGVILRAAQGMSNRQISREVGLHYNAVGKTRVRFMGERLGALQDRPRSGRKPTIALEIKRRILSEVTQPPPGLGRWSVRTMAQHLGVSKATVQRLWAQNELKPHLKKIFKLSSDPEFELKFWDVIGLYLDPPERAVVLCSDEKSQIQALQRTQPGLPLGLGHVRTETHDYYRHGTLTLFAALDYLQGKVFARTAKRHTHRQWLDFLKQLDREIAPHLDIHIILDNYATHKHAAVRKWLAKRPRIKLHFVPTGSSWLNLVERFFRDLSQQAILPGSFASVAALSDAITHYLARHNLNPKRYVWRADGAAVLAKIQRAWEIAIGEQHNM
jgi:transposase/AraC-like DNA-binding protein